MTAHGWPETVISGGNLQATKRVKTRHALLHFTQSPGHAQHGLRTLPTPYRVEWPKLVPLRCSTTPPIAGKVSLTAVTE